MSIMSHSTCELNPAPFTVSNHINELQSRREQFIDHQTHAQTQQQHVKITDAWSMYGPNQIMLLLFFLQDYILINRQWQQIGSFSDLHFKMHSTVKNGLTACLKC